MNEDTIRVGAEATKEIAVTGGKVVDSFGKLARYFDGMLPRAWRDCRRQYEVPSLGKSSQTLR